MATYGRHYGHSGDFVTVDTTGGDNAHKLLVTVTASDVAAAIAGTAFADLGANAKANVKASAGYLRSIYTFNKNAAIRYLQIFNLATAPVEDTSVPVFSFAIPGGSAANPGVVEIGADFFGQVGYYGATGLAWGVSVDPNVWNSTGVTVAEHIVNGIFA